MNKRKYLLFAIVLLLIPVVVNGLLLIPAITQVVGEPKDWLSFWGSYSGALITGIISFVILYKTIESNKLENDKQRLIDYNKQLQRDIADAVCTLNTCKIVECYKQDRDAQKISGVDAVRLEAYKLYVSNYYNTFVILYPEVDGKFLDYYCKTKDKIINFIDTLVEYQNTYEIAFNIHVKKELLEQLTAFAIGTSELESAIYNLWEKAQVATKDLDVK